MKRASFRVIGNVSLWETIPRSLATTFITLLPIVSLLLFGGDTLKDFAFALLVGIGSGAYSSIFIAAPLVAVFKEREPEYAQAARRRARRRGVGRWGAPRDAGRARSDPACGRRLRGPGRAGARRRIGRAGRRPPRRRSASGAGSAAAGARTGVRASGRPSGRLR